MTKPVYYRWTYSPSTGDVDLSHNHECHPSKVPTHGTMCQRRPESDLSVGYAYRLQGGWRIVDGDHRPVTDPHTVAKVIEHVGHAENFTKTAHNLWWKSGDWGRGLITPGGIVYTWPEEEMEHDQRALALGHSPNEVRHFNIGPEGNITAAGNNYDQGHADETIALAEAAMHRHASEGGMTVMPCPVCGKDGCTSCPIEPRTSRIHFGQLIRG